MSSDRFDVSFKTVDGIVLRGWLFPAISFGPAVIMTPGLPCVKEMFLPEVARLFQESGINSLIYDPRSLGESDGLPRNEIDPAKQVSDYSDALSFLATQNTVDPSRIALWGMSFSATVALCAASLDRRAKVCIAACPYMNLKPPADKIANVLAKCIADRESRISGNPPTYLSMLSAGGRNPAGLQLHPTPEELELILTAQERGAPNFDNRSTLETYYNFIAWSPKEIMKNWTGAPVLLIIPEQDTWSDPSEQLALFESFPSPKEVQVVPGKGHLTLFTGEDFVRLVKTQVRFIEENL